MSSLFARLHALPAAPPPLEQTRSTGGASGASPPRPHAGLAPRLGRDPCNGDGTSRPTCGARRVDLHSVRAAGCSSVPPADLAAARRADANELQDLLRKNPGLLTATFGDDEASLLTDAARHGKLASVQALLIHASLAGPPRLAEVVNHRDAHGNTALAQAIERGHPEVAAALLRYEETNVNRANRLSQTPLHLAAMQKDSQFAEALLRQSSIEPGLPDQNGKLPLHVAIESNNSAVAVMIAGHPKALPDQPDLEGRTPLEAAIRRCLPEVADALLKDERIDLDRPGPYNEPPLWQLFRHRQSTMSTAAVYGGASESWTRMLCKFVASPRIDANAQGPDGETVLTTLCRLRRRPPRPLISRIADPVEMGMDLAFSQWQIKTVQAVLDCSGNVHLGARNRRNQAPHDVAVQRGHSSLARVLSEQGTVRGTMERAFHERLVQG